MVLPPYLPLWTVPAIFLWNKWRSPAPAWSNRPPRPSWSIPWFCLGNGSEQGQSQNRVKLFQIVPVPNSMNPSIGIEGHMKDFWVNLLRSHLKGTSNVVISVSYLFLIATGSKLDSIIALTAVWFGSLEPPHQNLVPSALSLSKPKTQILILMTHMLLDFLDSLEALVFGHMGASIRSSLQSAHKSSLSYCYDLYMRDPVHIYTPA